MLKCILLESSPLLLKKGAMIYQVVCVCVCVCVCMHVCVCMCACTHECVYVCMYICMHVCLYVCIYASMYICMCVSMYVCVSILCVFTQKTVLSVPLWMKFTIKWTQCIKGTYKSVLHTQTHTHPHTCALCPVSCSPLHYCVLQHVKSVQETVKALQVAHWHLLLIVWANKNMRYRYETAVRELWKNYV